MEDEKQLFKNLLKQPYSRQALDDICDAFDDLRGRDRRALLAEFSSSQLGKDIENFSRQLAQTLAQFKGLSKVDYKEALVRLARRIPYEIARDKKQAKNAGRLQALHAAIAAEITAKAEKYPLAFSIEYAGRLVPGVRSRLRGYPELHAYMEKYPNWPTAPTIKSYLNRASLLELTD